MYWRARTRRIGYWWSVVALVGHLIGTAIIFIALVSIGWLVSIALHALHRYHPFPDEIFRFIVRVELYLVYAAAVVSAIVLCTGTVGFCKQLLEDQR